MGAKAAALALLLSGAAAAAPVAPSTAAAQTSDVLTRFAHEESADGRLKIVQALAAPSLHSNAALLLLGHATGDLSDKVRAAASVALLSYDDQRAFDFVDRELSSEQGESVRMEVCRELADPKKSPESAAAVDLLARRLTDDPSPAIRLLAVKGLAARADRRALPVLNQAAVHDENAAVRKAAKIAFAELFSPPKKPAPAPKAKPKPVERLDETGHLHCGQDAGVCQCTNGVITPKPHCLTLEDCRHLYETTYQNEGNFGCTWDGQDVEEQR